MGRFLFDECVGKPVMEDIHRLVGTAAEFTHICDYFRQGILDIDWVPRIAAEGGWVVITPDGGKHSPRGHKLPDLCRDYGVTHVILSPTLHNKKSAEKAGVIVSMWPKIERLVEEPPGSRFRLRYKETKGRAGLIVVLEKVEPPTPEPDGGGPATDSEGQGTGA